MLHTLPEAVAVLLLAFSHDPAVVIAAIGLYATTFHSLYLRPEMFGGFAVNPLLRIAQTGNFLADAMLPELKVTSLCPASTPFLHSSRLVPIMSFDTSAEFVSPLGRIKNPFAILVENVVSVLLGHPSASAVQGSSCKHNVNVGVSITLVMDRKISTHSTLHKVFLHILPNHSDVDLAIEFFW